jgi:phosphatidylglycerol---prolipoprotein diacylglyceryl transferase
VLQTIFYLPETIAGIPLFGFGWALAAWVVIALAWVGWLARSPATRGEITGLLPVLGIVAAAIIWVLPNMQVHEPPYSGLPIRGYGVMLLIAVLAAMAMASHQARRAGLNAEVIQGMGFWLILSGLAGARAFYVALNWNDFTSPSIATTLGRIVMMNFGGIVVYGALLGGFAALAFLCYRQKLPLLAIADILTPAFLVGLAIGRIGCFFNGCCYGGICEPPEWGVRFPANSPPYQHQADSGAFHGLQVTWDDAKNHAVISKVYPNSAAAENVKVGDTVLAAAGVKITSQDDLKEMAERWQIREMALEIERDGERRDVSWTMRAPRQSLAVYPTQLYSTVDAAILCFLTWAYFPFRRRDGEVMAMLFFFNPMTRILLEIVRDDEPGRFGTLLTISQLLAVGMMIFAVILFLYIRSTKQMPYFRTLAVT